MRELRRWDVELKCFGYWGFGGGYAKAKGFEYEDRGLYCNVCPESQACWDLHKQRVAGIAPEATAEFEKMAKEKQGPELMQAWWELTKMADPYTMISGGNIEDGMSVGFSGQVKSRDEWSLKWPLEPITPEESPR